MIPDQIGITFLQKYYVATRYEGGFFGRRFIDPKMTTLCAFDLQSCLEKLATQVI